MKKSKRCTVPVQDLNINKLPTPEELRKFFHLRGRSMLDDDDTVEYVYPSHLEPPKHGPVKKYTKKEIKEYNDAN